MRLSKTLLLVLVPAFAVAEPPDPVAQARNDAERAFAKMHEGDALLAKDNLRGACQAFEDAIAILPSWWMPRLAAARCGRVVGMPIARVLEHAELAVRSRPQITLTHLQYGLALEESGRVEEAIAAYEQALGIHADLVEARFRLGFALAKNGKPQQARRHLEQVLSSRPDYVIALVHLAKVYETLGLQPEAERSLQQIVQRSRYPSRAMAQLALYYERHGQQERAREVRARYEARFGKGR